MNLGPQRGRRMPEAQALTLGMIYELHIRPLWAAEGRAAATLREFATAVSLWSEFCGIREPSVIPTDGSQSADKPAEPVAEAIDKADLLAFRGWLASTRGSSTRTQNKRVAELSTILRAASEILGIPAPPRIKPLVCRANNGKPYLTNDEVGAIYDAADAATWPARDSSGEPIDTADQWRAAIVLFWFYGFRTQELIAFERDHGPLLWRNVFDSAESPTSSRAANASGWLAYVPQKQRAKKPDELVLPLATVVREHLDAIRPSARPRPDRPVFAWPHSSKLFFASFAAIIAASGVRLRPTLWDASPTITPAVFRKTCATAHNLNSRGVAPLVLGHAPRNASSVVTDTHYDNPEAALVRAFESLPFPARFAGIRSRTDRQLRLF